MTAEISILVLMCTFNGQDHLHAQLESLKSQTYMNWSLLISDDGSTDNTLEIIDDFSAQNPQLNMTVVKGPQKGATQNFLSALRHSNCTDRYIAFCDQDDVWTPDKLARAAHILKDQNDNMPFAYTSTAQIVNKDLSHIGVTPIPKRAVNFENLLVENCITGNTIVLNKTAVEAVRQHSEYVNVPFHDWWALLVVSALGGQIHVDETPSVLYRQHASNVVGAATGFARKRRNALTVMGRYQLNLRKNTTALGGFISALPTKNQTALRALARVQSTRFNVAGIVALLKLGIRRQNAGATIAMCFGLLIGVIAPKDDV